MERFALQVRCTMNSRGPDEHRVEEAPLPEEKKSFKSALIGAVVIGIFILVAALFVAYLLYDIYRLFAWVGSKI